MKRVLFFLLGFMTTWSPVVFAFQTIPPPAGGGPVSLTTIPGGGEHSGVSFTDSNPYTLEVNSGQPINSDNINPTAVSPFIPGVDSILFLGPSGTSIVNGAVGPGLNSVLDITAGQAAGDSVLVIFNGVSQGDVNTAVNTATFHVNGSSTMQFNHTANATGSFIFNNDGTLIIGAGQTFNAASIANLANNTGTLTLNSASIVNSSVGTTPSIGVLKQINLLGNATINGATGATTFFLGANQLTLVGSLTLPTAAVINTTVISDTTFGKIFETGANSIVGPNVTVNVDATNAILTGAPLFVVSAQGTTSGVPIIVTSNNPAISFLGFNLNGNIEIIPDFLTPSVSGGVGSSLATLFPIAVANPTSDLFAVLLALNTLSGTALSDALAQISPVSGLVGVGRESFNTARQYQRVWLEHLQRNRCKSRCACCDPCGECCNPCCFGGLTDGPMVWGDGFGYYGHQDNKDGFNGYKATTWGTVLGVETPILCRPLRAGVGVGYAFTDLDESEFGSGTDIHNYQGTAYFSYDTYSWFVDGGFSFGWNRYDGERHISFPGILRTARAEYDGQEYTEFLVAGYDYHWKCFEITPLASLLYTHLHIEDYTETGASSLNLHIDEQNYDFVESGLGIKAAYLVQTCRGLYIPEVHTMWLHDFKDNELNVDSSFTGIGAAAGTVNNRGPRFDRNTWNIGASVTCLACDNFSILAAYDYERSSSYYDHQGMLQLSYGF